MLSITARSSRFAASRLLWGPRMLPFERPLFPPSACARAEEPPAALKQRDERASSSASVPEAAPQVSKVRRLNHVAIAVPDIARAADFYRSSLGAQVSEPEDLPEHGVTVVFVELENTKLELLQPLGDRSPVAKFLEKNPDGGMHHICLEVQGIEGAMKRLKASGVRLLNEEPKIGAHGLPVVFLHPKDCNGVLTELEETA